MEVREEREDEGRRTKRKGRKMRVRRASQVGEKEGGILTKNLALHKGPFRDTFIAYFTEKVGHKSQM